jgi:hypothetical protein
MILILERVPRFALLGDIQRFIRVFDIPLPIRIARYANANLDFSPNWALYYNDESILDRAYESINSRNGNIKKRVDIGLGEIVATKISTSRDFMDKYIWQFDNILGPRLLHLRRLPPDASVNPNIIKEFLGNYSLDEREDGEEREGGLESRMGMEGLSSPFIFSKCQKNCIVRMKSENDAKDAEQKLGERRFNSNNMNDIYDNDRNDDIMSIKSHLESNIDRITVHIIM